MDLFHSPSFYRCKNMVSTETPVKGIDFPLVSGTATV
jgi:hypothetical protein